MKKTELIIKIQYFPYRRIPNTEVSKIQYNKSLTIINDENDYDFPFLYITNNNVKIKCNNNDRRILDLVLNELLVGSINYRDVDISCYINGNLIILKNAINRENLYLLIDTFIEFVKGLKKIIYVI